MKKTELMSKGTYILPKTREVNPVGENTSLIFTVSVKSVPLYYFKLAYVDLQTAIKKFSKPTSRNGEIGRFNLESHF